MIRKIYLLAIAVLLLLSPSLFASHMLGYDMQLINIKDANNNPTDTYKWRLRFYRDVTGVPIPGSFSFNIYKVSDNTSAGTFTVSKINPQTFINYSPELCAPIASQNKIELGIYESPVLNYGSLMQAGGYYATTSHCCRNTGIVNVQGESSSYSGLFYVLFPRLNAGVATRYNSSPRFNTLPMYGFTVGKQYSIDWSATDPDGDSLVYSIVKPLDGGPTAPSFSEIPFPSGYSLTGNIADGNPDVTINSSTGIISYKPTIANRYLLAVKVEEYRKIVGVPTKIGEVRRELQMETFLSAELPPKLYDTAPNTTKVDTMNVSSLQTKIINLRSDDTPNDSVFIRIIAEPGATSNNILDTNLIDAAWSDSLGNTYRGMAAEQYIVRAKRSALATLTINADSNSASIVPYKFKIISYDQTCFTPLADTLNYVLYVLGNTCYTTTTLNYTACDSFTVPGGRTYNQSTTLIDTINTVVGCNLVTIRNINIIPSPIANFDNLNIYVTDTSQTYVYKVDSQSNATYQWNVSSKGSIVSGANTNTVNVKWNVDTAMQQITCFINRGNCFDSVYSPIVISHLVGIQNEMSNLQVYPNPVNDVLMFNSTDNFDRALISIYNTMGQKIAETSINNNYADVSNVGPGVYTFTVLQQGKLYRGKFVK